MHASANDSQPGAGIFAPNLPPSAKMVIILCDDFRTFLSGDTSEARLSGRTPRVRMVLATLDQASECLEEEICYPGWLNSLGDDIEAHYHKHMFVPHAKRNNSQIYILAKFPDFYRPGETAWTSEVYDAAANATGVSFLTGHGKISNDNILVLQGTSTSIENVGPLIEDEFHAQLSQFAAIVGVDDSQLLLVLLSHSLVYAYTLPDPLLSSAYPLVCVKSSLLKKQSCKVFLEMLSTFLAKFLSDFLICASLSFVLVLIFIDVGIRLYTNFSPEPSLLSLRVTSTIRLSQVIEAHEYLQLVLEFTLGSTLVIFVIREFAFPEAEGKRKSNSDVEARTEKAAAAAWGLGEKTERRDFVLCRVGAPELEPEFARDRV
ncbi:hypothetical protein C8R43DRAFT_958242 [Mycena crocata]|nr:hypothetical protein C8R43DRAFT_958242 [Mycena crocata]